MIEYFKTYWYLFVILFAMIVLTLFVGKKALVASSKRREEMNRIMEKAKRAKELRDAYRELTPEIIANAPAAALAEGIALCLESACQKTEDTDGFYDSMTDGQKKIYALYYLISDANENSLSTFFKSSYRPLTSDAVNAAKEIFDSSAYTIIETMFEAYDENSENGSVTPQDIDRLNSEFDSILKSKDLFVSAGEYIKANKNEFIR